jgi:oligopeptide/dipeptide ABC transporter ATP-binding protein
VSVSIARLDAPVPLASLDVEGLRVALAAGGDVVSEIDLTVSRGEVVGLVGESGSGKTTIASALLGHARAGARIVAGRVFVGGIDILAQAPEARQRLRGRAVSYVAQDPATALNPARRVGPQIEEMLSVHEPALGRAARAARVDEVLIDVGLPTTTPELLRRFPHQLSGGQQQRVLLALAFVLRPKLIVLDEPTTALDVSTQARVLATIRRLCRSYDIGALYVSHDLAVVQSLVDRIVVLYAGRVVESGPRERVFSAPLHPYTRGLLDAIPDAATRRPLRSIAGQAPSPGARTTGCAFASRCPRRRDDCARETPFLLARARGHAAACWHPLDDIRGALFSIDGGAINGETTRDRQAAEGANTPLLRVRGLHAAYGARQVLFDVSFDLERGECLALVGESGSGKTTLSRSLAGVGRQNAGEVLYDGFPLAARARDRRSDVRRRIQYIFQNPYRALNPRRTVGETLGAVLRHFFVLDPTEVRRRAEAAVASVALPASVLDGYPRELSGGERQRVAVARALVCEPSLLICDEITSSLDVSVQGTILKLLGLLRTRGLSILFVTHDLGIVRALADRVVVLHEGRVVERGSTDDVLDHPVHPYTRALVKDSPLLHRNDQGARSWP